MKPLKSPSSQPAAFTVDEFCDAHRISRTRLYAFWKEGRGPRYLVNGTRRLITAQAAADWTAEREAEAAYAERLRQEIASAPDRDAARAISKREEKELQKYPGLIDEIAALYSKLGEEH
jgi:hypothetical protein